MSDSTPVPPLVGVVMGSDSDWPVMEAAVKVLEQFEIACDVDVVSAHRTPSGMLTYAQTAAERGLRVLIAGAGGAAHLPGMLAAATSLPVIGVPVARKHLDGMDSLLSIVQMPSGVPVATVAIDNAHNAGLLAVRILGASDPTVRDKMVAFQDELRQESEQKAEALRRRREGPPVGFSA